MLNCIFNIHFVVDISVDFRQDDSRGSAVEKQHGRGLLPKLCYKHTGVQQVDKEVNVQG